MTISERDVEECWFCLILANDRKNTQTEESLSQMERVVKPSDGYCGCILTPDCWLLTSYLRLLTPGY